MSVAETTTTPQQLTQEELKVGKDLMHAKLIDMRRSRSGQVPLSEPSDQERMHMEQAFRAAPNSRKAKEHFQRTLSPEQYLLYLKSQKNVVPTSRPRRRATKAQTTAHITVDVETQTQRPAFVLPAPRKIPKQK